MTCCYRRNARAFFKDASNMLSLEQQNEMTRMIVFEEKIQVIVGQGVERNLPFTLDLFDLCIMSMFSYSTKEKCNFLN
jgi:hypothetical protein